MPSVFDTTMFNVPSDVTSDEEEKCGEACWKLNPMGPEMTQTLMGELVLCPHTDAGAGNYNPWPSSHFSTTTLYYEKGE